MEVMLPIIKVFIILLLVVLVSIDFPINSKRDALFHRIAYDYFRADWNGLRDHLRDVPWEYIFKLSASVGDVNNKDYTFNCT